MTNLTRFDTHGLELFINIATGECFASQRALARMCAVNESAIRKYIGAHQIPIIKAETLTAGGVQGAHLINEEGIYQMLSHYKPELLIQCAKAGLRLYLHLQAGFTFKVEPPQQPKPQLPSHELAVKTAEAIKSIQDLLALTQPRLTQYLIEAAMNDIHKMLQSDSQSSDRSQELFTCEAYASTQGFSVSRDNRTQLGKFVAKLYREEFKQEPDKQYQEVGGAQRQVNVYHKDFLAKVVPLFFA